MESLRSSFDPSVAEPRAWNAGVSLGHAIGMFAIPYLLTPLSYREGNVLLGLQYHASLSATIVFALIAPALVAGFAKRSYMAWGLLPLAVGSIWLLAERFIRMLIDSSISCSLDLMLYYACVLTVVWLVSTSPIALYRYLTAYWNRHANSKSA